jgi:hypothetical protein
MEPSFEPPSRAGKNHLRHSLSMKMAPRPSFLPESIAIGFQPLTVPGQRPRMALELF